MFWGGPDYESARSFKEFWNLGHIFYFALITWLLSKWMLIRQQSVPKQWFTILFISLFLGVLIEILQYGTERTPDMGDVFRDLTGSFMMLAFFPIYSKILTNRKKMLLKAIAIILVLIQLLPLTISLADEIIAKQQFPVLSNFETPFEKDRFEGKAKLAIKHIPSLSNSHILEVSLTTEKYSGTGLKYFPGNWYDYKTLQISLYLPHTKFLWIVCRVHDMQHTQGKQQYNDRFNQRFLLKQGWNNIKIDLKDVISAPKNRNMDPRQIRGIGLFAVSLQEPQIIYLDNIQLSDLKSSD